MAIKVQISYANQEEQGQQTYIVQKQKPLHICTKNSYRVSFKQVLFLDKPKKIKKWFSQFLKKDKKEAFEKIHIYIFTKKDNQLFLEDHSSSENTHVERIEVFETLFFSLHGIQLTIKIEEYYLDDFPDIQNVYTLTKRIQNSMYCIYQAYAQGLKFAIKVTLTQQYIQQQQEQKQSRYKKSLDILNYISTHHSIPPILEHDQNNMGAYMIMPWIEGENLQNILSQKKLSLLNTCKLIKKVSEVLYFLHKNNIVHRNIIPSNIILQKNQIYLLGFGFVKQLSPVSLSDTNENTHSLVQDSSLMVAFQEFFHYMPPEFFSISECNTSWDIYSVGTLFFKLLFSSYPGNYFKGVYKKNPIYGKKLHENTFSLKTEHILKILHEHDTDLVNKEIEGLPQKIIYSIDTILHKSLQKFPKERYSSIEFLIQNIDSLIKKITIYERSQKNFSDILNQANRSNENVMEVDAFIPYHKFKQNREKVRLQKLKKQLRETEQDLTKEKIENSSLYTYSNDLLDAINGSFDSGMQLPGKGNIQYLLQDCIGRGGMGTVYKAKNINTDEVVAIKVCNRTKEDEEEKAKIFMRFILEGYTMFQFNHSGVVRAIDIEHIGLRYYVMEYVNGQPLDQWINKADCNYQIALNVMIAISEAVKYLHDKDIIHRDLKPSNIMIYKDEENNEEFTVKILDFGLVQNLPWNIDLNKSDLVLGTPRFTAPEIFFEANPTPQSDIYSMGVIFYMLLTKQAPISGDPIRIIEEHTRNTVINYECIKDIHKNIPHVVISILKQMLERDVTSRYKSVDPIIKELYSIV